MKYEKSHILKLKETNWTWTQKKTEPWDSEQKKHWHRPPALNSANSAGRPGLTVVIINRSQCNHHHYQHTKRTILQIGSHFLRNNRQRCASGRGPAVFRQGVLNDTDPVLQYRFLVLALHSFETSLNKLNTVDSNWMPYPAEFCQDSQPSQPVLNMLLHCICIKDGIVQFGKPWRQACERYWYRWHGEGSSISSPLLGLCITSIEYSAMGIPQKVVFFPIVGSLQSVVIRSP